MLCKYCGWGDQITPSCMTSAAAVACNLNLENVRKFSLRFRGEPRPKIVHSIRGQGKDGKGDSFEFLKSVVIALAVILTTTGVRSQDNHELHHAQYQNWLSNEGFSCCNNQDCGALAESRVREVGGHIEVLVLDNLGDQWCPVESRHLIDQTKGKRLSPDWTMDHACIVSFASGGVCAKLKCFMEKGKF